MSVMYIKDAQGKWRPITTIKGDTGPAGPQGPQGETGYSPVRGVDYFSPEDIEAMVDAVAARFEDGDKETY